MWRASKGSEEEGCSKDGWKHCLLQQLSLQIFYGGSKYSVLVPSYVCTQCILVSKSEVANFGVFPRNFPRAAKFSVEQFYY